MRRYGLPRSRRLLKPSEFDASRGGHKSRDRYFTATGQVTGLTNARLGIAVSRRVSLKAVVRNRIKRQVRESFRRHQQQLIGIDVVVIAHTAAAAAGNPDLAGSLQSHWKRLSALCKKP